MNSQFNPSLTAAEAALPSIDLSQLAVRRLPAAGTPALRSRRRWFTRYVLPLGILAAFGGLFGWAAKESFLPAQAVTITPVIVTKAEVQQAGTPLFQAAGWIEPRPTATVVSSLAAGVVEELLVVEGQTVEKGQPLARLNDTDARLALRQAEAHLKLCEADVRTAEAKLLAARIALEKPNELRATLADAESALAQTKLTLGDLPFSIAIAQTRYQLAADNLERKEQAGDAIAARIVREAKAELAAAQSGLGELQARGPLLTAQVEALQRKCTALAEQLAGMSEQKRLVAETEANVAATSARRDQAELSIEASQLNFDRMTIHAPFAGRVLTVDARPGRRLMGFDPNSQQDSSAVATLYDPQMLQVRVDVRLENVPQVQIGQPVVIETAAAGKRLSGQVLGITTRADIQKNTLQVKVAINDPSAVITPEMLGQVTFLAQKSPVASNAETEQPLRMLVPRQLTAGSEGSSTIWVADVGQKVARQKTVALGRAGSDQLVEVVSGLTPTDKLIVGGRESLSDGSRIRITGEDQSIGVATQIAAGLRPGLKQE